MTAPAPASPMLRRPAAGAQAALWASMLVACLVGCAVVDPETEPGARLPAADAAEMAAVLDAAPSVPEPDAGLPVDPVAIELFPAIEFDEGRAQIAFDVPVGMRSVTLSADGPPGSLLVFEQIEDGAGQAWVSARPGPIDDADRAALPFPGPFLSPNRVVWGDGVATALVPNNPDVMPAPGRWHAELVADPPPPGTADVYVQLESGPVPVEGRLDLHFHFTEVSRWTAAEAAMDDEFRRMLNGAAVLLREVDVEIGAVTFTDVPVGTYSVSVQEELPRLLALSTHRTGLSVFIVGRIEDALGGPLAGIAGAVPTSSGLPGTGANGIAIARAFGDGRAMGATLSHEIGHALGLFHTVEANPAYGDQLDDTPAGEDSRENVMYPTGGQEARRFSPQQGTIMRRGRAVDGL